ncbi:MAG: hypothetical protein GXY51_00180 [Bacteroidetes bacterium]|jgi:hypothetical protein|nr:hypothetical protein [Bacteroidota bacterium]
MKTIDDIIRNSKDFFEDKEPAEGHFERFNRKLEIHFHHASKPARSIVPYLLRAAVATLLITLSSLWTWEHFIRPDRSKMALSEVSPHYREVENYYIYQVSLMENEIGMLDLNSKEEQRELLMDEINNMDSVYVNLQKELKANPGDERIINAMIEHYQTKLDVMNYILNQLKTMRIENAKTNTTQNEEINI